MSRRTLIQLGILVVAVAAAAPMFAVQASPDPVWLEQPDGTRFEARQWGDEWLHGWETAEGYSIVPDEQTGWWSFAARAASGELVATPLAVGIEAPPADLPRFLRPTGRPVERAAQLRASAQGIGPVREMTVTGTRNLPVILVNFAGRTPSYTTGQFQQLLFGTGNWSLRDYYSEVSYGRFTVAVGPAGVQGWYTASQGHDYYGTNNAEDKDSWPGDLAYEAVAAADAAGADFAPYDSDGNCYVDAVAIVHQGTGAEDTGSGIATDIWSHRWDLYSAQYFGRSHYGVYTTNDACPAGGFIKVRDYIVQAELIGTQMITVGLFAHEYGHALGLPDLYDTDLSSEGVGNWSLMAGGSWNRVSVAGDRPAHLDPWSKVKLGWVSPQQVTTTRTNEAISAVSGAADVYQFLTGSPTSGGEYFLLENRQKTGFDAGLPSSGLLVWHVDEARATQDNTDNDQECYPSGPSCATQHYHVAVVQADNAWDLERNVNRGDAGDPFPGSTAKTTFNGSSSPNVSLRSAPPANVAVTRSAAPAPR
jgi:M6 family metalloprotease-like protein